MDIKKVLVALCLSTISFFSVAEVSAAQRSCPANGKLKIFILSGQSNMVGFGQLKGSPGTMETYVKSNPEFAGNVAGVETRDFQRSQTESPSRQEYHWMRNWETYYLIGQSMGNSMINLKQRSRNQTEPK